MVPSGASQVTSSMLLALASVPRAGLATTQSSLHQPGSMATSPHGRSSGSPVVEVAAMRPSRTSAGVQLSAPPRAISFPSRRRSTGAEPNFTSISR